MDKGFIERGSYPVLFVDRDYPGYSKRVEYLAGVSFDLEEGRSRTIA